MAEHKTLTDVQVKFSVLPVGAEMDLGTNAYHSSVSLSIETGIVEHAGFNNGGVVQQIPGSISISASIEVATDDTLSAFLVDAINNQHKLNLEIKRVKSDVTSATNVLYAVEGYVSNFDPINASMGELSTSTIEFRGTSKLTSDAGA